MSTELRLRQDTAANIASVTPAQGEPAYDQTNKRGRWGDGSKQGGWPWPTVHDVQRQVGVFLTVEGSGSPEDFNTLTGSTGAANDGLAIPALVEGMKFGFFWPGEHDGSVTLDIDGVGAADVELNGEALTGGERAVGEYTEVVVDGSGDLQIVSSAGGGISVESEIALSGTAVDITGIPSTAKAVHLLVEGLSTNGTNTPRIVLGDSGGFETSGYAGHTEHGGLQSVWAAAAPLILTIAATHTWQCIIELTLKDEANNTWAIKSTAGRSDNTAGMSFSAGFKSLTGPLTQLQINAGGSDALDAGSVAPVFFS